MAPPNSPARQVSFVPPQHGAWAFVALPLVVGISSATWTPVLLVLAFAWIAAYPWSYFVLAVAKEQTAKHPRPERLHRPLLTWTCLAIPALVLLVALRPWLIWIGAFYLLAFSVNVAFALRRDDRALVNDGVFIAECALIVPISWMVGAFGRTWGFPAFATVPTQVWILTAAVALLLIGSTVHVKSLIRERSSERFGQLSVAVAIVSLVISVVLAAWWGLPAGLWLVPAFAAAVARSLAMRRASPRPAQIGIIELGPFVLLAFGAVILGSTT